MSVLLRILLPAVAIAAIVLVAALTLQRRLIYFPARTDIASDMARAARLGVVPWRDAQGGLRGWRVRDVAEPRARVLVLHGNAGSALDRAYYLAALAPRGLDVVLLEYPGYGARPGAPSFASLSDAATEALDALAAEGAPVWVLGESLGSGVAARLVTLRPHGVSGLLLVTPFAELSAVARRHYRLFCAFLLRDRWSPLRDLAGWHGPTVLLLAGSDEVVTLAEGQRLAQALPGPRHVVLQEHATHNGLDLSPELTLWDEAVRFLAGPR